jgi:hypothetical protein
LSGTKGEDIVTVTDGTLQCTSALEVELVNELEELGPLFRQIPRHITEQVHSKLLLELGLLSGIRTKGGGVVCTSRSALEAGPGPIEGPSESSSSFGLIGGTYDEDSEEAASTSSERVMFCMITDGTSSSGRLAITA